MAKVKLPRHIKTVQLLNGRIVVSTARKSYSFRYEQLTERQENKLRALAAPPAKRREVKPSRTTGKPSKRVNYAQRILGA